VGKDWEEIEEEILKEKSKKDKKKKKMKVSGKDVFVIQKEIEKKDS